MSHQEGEECATFYKKKCERKAMNFYPRFPGDYSKKTVELSLMEHGAYCLLLDAYYANEKPLPNNPKTLHRISRAMSPAECNAVDTVIETYFFLGRDGLLHNKKADEVIADAIPRIEAARINGRKGGRPKAHKASDIEFHDHQMRMIEENLAAYPRDSQPQNSQHV